MEGAGTCRRRMSEGSWSHRGDPVQTGDAAGSREREREREREILLDIYLIVVYIS